MNDCCVETFCTEVPVFGGRVIIWGWQCFTCPAEVDGFTSLVAAEQAAEEHRTMRLGAAS
jgi:hypothetical protein